MQLDMVVHVDSLVGWSPLLHDRLVCLLEQPCQPSTEHQGKTMCTTFRVVEWPRPVNAL